MWQGCTILGARLPRYLTIVYWHLLCMTLSIKLASFHPLGACNFQGAPRFLEDLCTPAIQLHKFQTMALVGRKSSTVHTDRSILEKRNCTTHWIRVWVGPSASLGILKERNISCPCHKLNSASFNLITILTELMVMK
jgi:hypothetical protein